MGVFTTEEQILYDQLMAMSPKQYDKWMDTPRAFNPSINVGKICVARERAINARVKTQ